MDILVSRHDDPRAWYDFSVTKPTLDTRVVIKFSLLGYKYFRRLQKRYKNKKTILSPTLKIF